MKFYFKYFFLGIIVILAFNYKLFFGDSSTDQVNTSDQVLLTVDYGIIKNSVEVVGSAELVDEQSLGFNIAGTVTKVNVKAGDYVTKGQVIAAIDSTDALNSIQDSKISLQNSKINLQELYKGPDESQIMSSQNSITTSQNNLDIAIKELENLRVSQKNIVDKQVEDTENSKKDLSSMKASLELAREELELLKKEKSQTLDNTVSNKSTTIKNTEDTFKTYLVEIEKMNTDADLILGVTDKNAAANDSYEIYLSAKNSNYKREASILLADSISNLNELEQTIDNYDYSGDRDEIVEILRQISLAYDLIYDMEDSLYRAIENSVEAPGIFAQTQIDSFKSSTSSNRSTALSKMTTITSAINTLNTLSDIELLTNSNQNAIASKEESIRSQELSITKQELSITNALKTYQETLASQKVALTSKENDVASKRKALEIAEQSYVELLEGPTAENIEKAENSIRQAEIRVADTTKSLEDYELTAPFDGIVRKIDYMVGDNLKNDTDKYVYLENPDLLEITVKLDQIDIVNVQVGNDAIITFDAYSTTPVNARVSLIDTTPISTSGVVSYEVKLVLDDESFHKTVLSGMTANVEIITEEKKDILVLRTQAVKDKDGKKYVDLQKNGVVVETEVETGFAGDGMIEIVSGLNEGDIVIYERVSFSGATTTSGGFGGSSNVRVGGGGGGMMMRGG